MNDRKKDIDPAKRIALGILAHVDAGKTTLSEAILYTSGNISKLGRVDKGDSFLDTNSLERSRGITVFSKQAIFNYGDGYYTLIDTPGHVDFSSETERTLQVLDYAVLVISATDGVQSHTETLWKLLEKYGVPCFIFVNKIDLSGFDRAKTLAELKSKLGDGCVDFGDEDSFIDDIVLCDEKLFEKYSDGELPSVSDISDSIKRRKIFPCMFGSALKTDGVDFFLKTLDKYTISPEYGSEFGGKVFKISEDKGRRLTFLKITGGALKVREVLKSEKNRDCEKVDEIRIYSGEKYKAVSEAPAGTVAAVTGITFAAPGDGLGEEKSGAEPILTPIMTYRLVLPDGCDAHDMFEKIKILEAEDPQLMAEWNSGSGEIQVRIMGDIQLEILRQIIEDRFGCKVGFSEGSIIYKETAAGTAEGVGHFEPLRHYAEVHLIIKPGKRGSGIVIKSECREDLLDKNWQRLIMTHLAEKTHVGILTGSPVTDIEISLVSGRAHAKHTEGGDFRQATYRAVRHGLRRAGAVLLEPVYEFTLRIPSGNTGRALSDIRRMHGDFEPIETEGDESVIRGTAPVSEMYGYSKEVVKYTHGKGKLFCSLKGYEPCHNAREVTEKIGYNCDGDTENPCGSVFCSHGAGYNVKWDEVEEHMHLPAVLEKKDEDDGAAARQTLRSRSGEKDLFALDKELMQIFEKAYGPVKTDGGRDSRFAFTEKSRIKNLTASKEPKGKSAARTYIEPDYLLVDGYNVIFAWEKLRKLAKSSIDAARGALQNILCNYRGYKKCEVILVFDAYKVHGNLGEVEKLGNINIVYTKEAETADTYIEKVSHELAKNHRVRVVTSDSLEQLIIFGNGALRVSADDFLAEVTEIEEEIRRIISENH